MAFQRSQLSTGTLCDDIVEQIAELEGVDPLTLPPLFETIDAELLTRLYESRSGDAELSISFVYAGYTVSVRHDGALEVVPKERTAVKST
ncbi:HalOD1 output domain-containing protein [Haloprofundus halobius]|uniref:HalOD1 output domain-containing protein n=1 Tax=Haloprofundus halobius TaxID=2876194 RepID=UPI001CCC8DA2|nr:HalOD1 output domain-containing protein [Haloprofundus halobius]